MEEKLFIFRRGKGRRVAIGLLIIIGEAYIEKGKEVYEHFMIWKRHSSESTGKSY